MGVRNYLHTIRSALNRHILAAQLLMRQDPGRLQAMVTYFEQTLGGAESSRTRLPTQADLEAWPWYTYPAIEFLGQVDFSRCAVFEYGSGNSSKYWAVRAESVISVESDPRWFDTVRRSITNNQELRLVTDYSEYARYIGLTGKKFDIVVIDSIRRFNCAQEAVLSLKPGGCIILDNADWYPNTAALLRAKGFAQIDFIGWGPVNSYAWCTSLFSEVSLNWPRQTNSKIQVLGGLDQVADDDRLL
jgi:hypothetical protein